MFFFKMQWLRELKRYSPNRDATEPITTGTDNEQVFGNLQLIIHYGNDAVFENIGYKKLLTTDVVKQ